MDLVSSQPLYYLLGLALTTVGNYPYSDDDDVNLRSNWEVSGH